MAFVSRESMPAPVEALSEAETMAPTKAQPTTETVAPIVESVPKGGEETAMEVPDLQVPEMAYMQTPTWDDILEEDTQ